jgi:hypothetical protein
VTGIPRDLASARSLFARSPFEFERWAVSLVQGTPNQKQVGDRGIDGVVRFYTDSTGATGRVLVSVKGGKSVGPQYVRDLVGTVQTERAEMGGLLTLAEPTRGIYDAVAHAGTYQWPVTGTSFPAPRSSPSKACSLGANCKPRPRSFCHTSRPGDTRCHSTS